MRICASKPKTSSTLVPGVLQESLCWLWDWRSD